MIIHSSLYLYRTEFSLRLYMIDPELRLVLRFLRFFMNSNLNILLKLKLYNIFRPSIN